MKGKKIKIRYKKERVVLSDILPYELPLSFSPRFFYEYLIFNKIEFKERKIIWESEDLDLAEIHKLLFGFRRDKIINGTAISLNEKESKTIPFAYKVSHKETDFRELIIIHPKNQIAIVEFYEKYKDLILYFSSISPFSLRKPYKIAAFFYYKDYTHNHNLGCEEHETVEEYNKEYKNLKTFFTYKNYSNIHKFYESYKYHNCEKKYEKLVKFDISKCFDSIYTHSLSWALLSKDFVKDNLGASKKTFSGVFDNLMQELNYGETNGIVIGPELSRIFAELILQQIDREVFESLKKQKLIHKKDYEIFRYVDDFFIFYNDEKVRIKIFEIFLLKLKDYKFYLNEAKTITYEKPIITEITIAKQKISDLFNKSLEYKLKKKDKKEIGGKEDEDIITEASIYVSSNKLITKFKTILKETKVTYKDILVYSLAILDRKVFRLIENYKKLNLEQKNEDQFVKAFFEVIEFTFFIYSVSPKTNTTIKICSILSRIIKFFTKKGNVNFDNKHLIFKKIYDEIFLVFNKNKCLPHTQIETLYLLLALRELGKEYRLEPNNLCEYFDIDLNNKCCNNP